MLPVEADLVWLLLLEILLNFVPAQSRTWLISIIATMTCRHTTNNKSYVNQCLGYKQTSLLVGQAATQALVAYCSLYYTLLLARLIGVSIASLTLIGVGHNRIYEFLIVSAARDRGDPHETSANQCPIYEPAGGVGTNFSARMQCGSYAICSVYLKPGVRPQSDVGIWISPTQECSYGHSSVSKQVARTYQGGKATPPNIQ
jgi:hypothetical protein